jgi:hypothetical protein
VWRLPCCALSCGALSCGALRLGPPGSATAWFRSAQIRPGCSRVLLLFLCSLSLPSLFFLAPKLPVPAFARSQTLPFLAWLAGGFSVLLCVRLDGSLLATADSVRVTKKASVPPRKPLCRRSMASLASLLLSLQRRAPDAASGGGGGGGRWAGWRRSASRTRPPPPARAGSPEARPPARKARPPARKARPPARKARPPARKARPPARKARPPGRKARPPARSVPLHGRRVPLESPCTECVAVAAHLARSPSRHTVRVGTQSESSIENHSAYRGARGGRAQRQAGT